MTFQGELKPFQKAAKDRMVERGNFLLAHRMGLGKSVVSIAAIEELIDSGEIECCMIICPASIKRQWARAIKKFTDGALVQVIEGTKAERTAQYRRVKRGEVEYFIVNYEQVVNDWDIIRFLDFDAVVGDEIQAIKNPGAKRSRHVKRLRKVRYRYGLTGQPMENKPEEAFSIMEFIDHAVLGNEIAFDRKHVARKPDGSVRYYRNLPSFRKQMKPVLDRKTRKDVADQLPKLIEESLTVEFDPVSLKLYRYISQDLVQAIMAMPHYSSFNVWDHYTGVSQSRAQGNVMARLMALRMLCDHPRLLLYSADQFDDQDVKAGSAYASTLKHAGLLEKLPVISPKMRETLETIDEILEADEDNKVVLFSFFKPMLALLGSKVHHGYVIYTGDVKPADRDRFMRRFQRDPNCRIFLSSDAGGVGLDLPEANYLINYDLPFSAGKWEQRNGRIDRISSQWPHITLLTMLMEGSIEERILDILETKSAVASAWLDGTGVSASGRFDLTLGTLTEFLMEKAT